MQCVVEHRQQLGLEVHVGGAPGESRQVRLVQAVAEGVEGAGLTAFEQCPGCQRHEGLRQIAVDLAVTPVVERADEPVAHGRRLAGTGVIRPAVGVTRQPDARRKPVRCAEGATHAGESATLGVHHEHRPASRHGSVHQPAETGGLARAGGSDEHGVALEVRQVQSQQLAGEQPGGLQRGRSDAAQDKARAASVQRQRCRRSRGRRRTQDHQTCPESRAPLPPDSRTCDELGEHRRASERPHHGRRQGRSATPGGKGSMVTSTSRSKPCCRLTLATRSAIFGSSTYQRTPSTRGVEANQRQMSA